jgi:hypothetical protein
MGRWTTGSENAEWNLRLELGTPKSMILGEGFFKERVSVLKLFKLFFSEFGEF